MSPTLSIIIPCYNGWKYFSRCLESLENQDDVIDEIIIIDDCSTDNSYNELIRYSENSNLNIRVIKNNENSGPGKSRENGIKYANSEYITFCDCDDWYEKNFVKSIKSILNSRKIDMIIFDTYTAFDDDKKSIDNTTKRLIGRDKKYILAHYPMSLCRLIVKKSLIDKVHHTDLRHAEDGVVVAQLISCSEDIYILDKPFYNYYFREDSASKKPSQETCNDLLKAYEFIRSYVDEKYSSEIEYIGINYVCYGAVLCGLKAGVSKKKISTIIDTYESYNPNWMKNKYINSINKAKKVFLYFVSKRLFICLILLTKLHPLLVKIKKKI